MTATSEYQFSLQTGVVGYKISHVGFSNVAIAMANWFILVVTLAGMLLRNLFTVKRE